MLDEWSHPRLTSAVGTTFDVGLPKPNLMVAGLGAGGSNSSLSLTGIGPGVAYYFEPVNLYLAGTLALTGVELEDSNNKTISQSSAGIGGQILVGKEWWVSQNWGLGAAVEFIAASMKDSKDSSVAWTVSAFSFLFSATYN